MTEPKDSNAPINWANKYVVNEKLHDTSFEIVSLYQYLSVRHKGHLESNEWHELFKKWHKYRNDLGDLLLPTEESAKNETIDRGRI